jgi:hypothetical protein
MLNKSDDKIHLKQNKQRTYNVLFWRVRVTIFTMETRK